MLRRSAMEKWGRMLHTMMRYWGITELAYWVPDIWRAFQRGAGGPFLGLAGPQHQSDLQRRRKMTLPRRLTTCD